MALIKWMEGGEGLWVMSESCQGVLPTFLSPIFSVLFCVLVNRPLSLFLVWLCCCSICESICLKNLTSVSFCSSHLSFSFWSFFPLVSFERHLDHNCLGSSCPSLYIGESKSIVGPTAWSSNCCTLNLCQTNPIVRPWSHLNKSWSEGLITFHFYSIRTSVAFV